MARALHSSPLVAQRHSRGFTLIELMIVVVIVGILATLAVVGYRKLVQSSHVSEATGMVQNIRVAQEAYHSETQIYADISTAFPDGVTATAGLYPRTPQYGVVTAWGAACTACLAGMDWSMLPLHVDGPVLFGYATVAGAANLVPTPATVSVNGGTVTFPNPSTADWYIIGAEGELDNNPSGRTVVYGTSWTNQLLVSNEGQ
jgi:type IV pilus assembly protein PilA